MVLFQLFFEKLKKKIVCPGKNQPILIFHANQREMKTMKWGFKYEKHYVTNVRSETINSVNEFKKLLKEQRCVVL